MATKNNTKSISNVELDNEIEGEYTEEDFFDDNGHSPYHNEIIMLISIAGAALLVLSNFDMSGSVGKIVNGLLFGLFGMTAYITPLIVVGVTMMYLSNQNSIFVGRKCSSTIGILLDVCACIHLTIYDETMKLTEFYTIAEEERIGGGLLGGIICRLLYKMFGFGGTLVILILLAVIFLVIITDKMFFKWISSLFSGLADKVNSASSFYDDYDSYDDYVEYVEVEDDTPIRRQVKTYTFEKDNSSVIEDNLIIEDSSSSKDNSEIDDRTSIKDNTVMDDNSSIEKTKINKSTRNNYSSKKNSFTQIKPTKTNSDLSSNKENSDSSDNKVNNKDNSTVEIYEQEINRKFGSYDKPIKDLDIKRLTNRLINGLFGDCEQESDMTDEQIEDCCERINTFISNDMADKVDNKLYDTDNGNEVSDNSQSSTIVEDNINREAVNIDDDDNLESVITDDIDDKDNFESVITDDIDDKDNFESVITDDIEDRDNLESVIGDGEDDADGFTVSDDNVDGLDVQQTNKTVDKVTYKEESNGQLGINVDNVSSDNGNKKNVTRCKSANNEEGVAKVKKARPKKYKFPSVNLLNQPDKSDNANSQEHIETAKKLQSTFDSFGVGVKITNVSCGPAVTRYEVQPDQGVKVSKITNLADDIKLNLAAADIRIEAPIPGKAAVGIEVPNKDSNTMVSFRELIESKSFKTSKSALAFAVGKDIAGQVIIADIAKMPHLLIAGQTGAGKSVCINTLIMSILYKAHPDDVKLIMIDPKVVELSVYNGIPHLLIPVVTDPKKASGALNWAVAEMTDRYNKFAELGVRDISSFNEKVASVPNNDIPRYQKLPQIVIVVDELADLMMVAPGEVEDAICRLAQMARAAGLHLIIATQRPSVNVITGLIKANVPSRIAFSVASAIDSRTIIDGGGAEKLLGKGDMLFFPSGYPKPVRVQGAFITDKEVGEVVSFLTSQEYKSSVEDDIDSRITSAIATSASLGTSDKKNNGRDDYFVEAGKYIIEKDKASIGMLQRVYKIGFNRAARIMDQLCEAGVVGPEEGTKPRKILMSSDEFEKYIEECL